MNFIEPESPETEQEQLEDHDAETNLDVETSPSFPDSKQETKRTLPDWEPSESSGEAASAPRYPAEVSYSCLLIPRFHEHHLAGDITEDLVNWMKEVCISYGWRLQAIVIRPGYLQWVLTVPLTENPARVMRLTRQHTSQKIFEEYPRFKRTNMSGDFWAPGFYVAPGDQPLSLESISSFTLATRKQQGIF